MNFLLRKVNGSRRRLTLTLLQVAVLISATLAPLLQINSVSAAQLTSRKVAINDSRFSQAGVTYVFTFKLTTLTNDVEGIKIQACTTATGSCTAATSPFSFTPVSDVNDTGWDGTTDFADDATGANDCTPSANIMCLNRTEATVENDTGDRTIELVGVTNAADAGSNNTENVFLRISLYSTSNYTAPAFDTGTVVTAMVNQLSISATVEEKLTFCLYTGANCAAGGSSVDLGVHPGGAVTDTDSNTKIDIAANAANGISVGYYSTQTLTSGSNTIDSATAAGETDDPNTDEMFGFCVRASGGAVTAVAPYSTACTDNSTSDDTYGYDATNTFDQIASSGSGSDTTVLTLQFGVDITITTESGIYDTTARFIAIPTY